MCKSVNRSTCKKIAIRFCHYTFCLSYSDVISDEQVVDCAQVDQQRSGNFLVKTSVFRHQYGLVNSDDDLLFLSKKWDSSNVVSPLNDQIMLSIKLRALANISEIH